MSNSQLPTSTFLPHKRTTIPEYQLDPNEESKSPQTSDDEEEDEDVSP